MSPTTWTKIPKPSVLATTTRTINAGNPIGLLLALTYSTSSSVVTVGGDGWTKITKAT